MFIQLYVSCSFHFNRICVGSHFHINLHVYCYHLRTSFFFKRNLVILKDIPEYYIHILIFEFQRQIHLNSDYTF